MTTVWACEKTVVIVKQPGHLTSIKNDRGVGTRVCGGDLWLVVESGGAYAEGLVYLELVLARLGLRCWIEEIDGESL